MQPAADADFELEVKFDSPMTQKWQVQGLLVEESLSRYLRFNFQSDGQSTYVLAASLVNNGPPATTVIPASRQRSIISTAESRWTTMALTNAASAHFK